MFDILRQTNGDDEWFENYEVSDVVMSLLRQEIEITTAETSCLSCETERKRDTHGDI